MAPSDYNEWFKKITGIICGPRDWQSHLADESNLRNLMIRIPTGMGKTLGVLSAWTFHLQRGAGWPRRLVWCLPMRVLVEQTEEEAKKIVDRIPENVRPIVHVAMGGEDSGEWFLYPECPAIVIGTQDMLLSRALNRGYASSRARWPVEFGLLSQDTLWVMDEVQLMDVGLATSAQLQAFRDDDYSDDKQIKRCATWWMSATLQPDWLNSVDTAHRYPEWIRSPISISPEERQGTLFEIAKGLETCAIEANSNGNSDLARLVLEQHDAIPAGEYGRITLVVLNTVERACQLHDAIKRERKSANIELIHSRYRPFERSQWREFLSRKACSNDADRIIVATQVVEAGVDISAGCLITELAPWPSLVQRFGRCARYGGSGRVVVVDRGRSEKLAPPYTVDQLESAWSAVQELHDVGLRSLEEFEDSLSDQRRRELYPFEPQHLLMRNEFDELFDTTPDLTGADLDISRFIRTGDERDLQVCWVDVAKGEKPDKKYHPTRDELCSVKFTVARDWLCGTETKTAKKPRLLESKRNRVWIWDWLDGEWKEATRAALLPGRIVCIASGCGGYTPERGFDPSSNSIVPVVAKELERSVETREVNDSDNQLESDSLSFNRWKTISMHCEEVAEVAAEIATSLRIDDDLTSTLRLAGIWHDVGKAHPAFQNMLLDRHDNAEVFRQQVWAKSGGTQKNRSRYFALDERKDERRGFRHELASALALFAVLESHQPDHPALLGHWKEVFESMGVDVGAMDFHVPTKLVEPLLACDADKLNLLLYLIASHHGKVRVSLHASPHDQDYVDWDGRGLPIRGVREGDELPEMELNGERLPSLSLTLQPATLGLSSRTGTSWRERCIGLIKKHGASSLAYLEAVFRAADVRASRFTTEDPLVPQPEEQSA